MKFAIDRPVQIGVILTLMLFIGSDLALGQQEGHGLSSPKQLDGLSKKSYANRQRATMEMWRERDQSRQRVREAINHPDPEVAQRAEWILKQWRRGSLLDPNAPYSRVQSVNEVMPIGRLLDLGQFHAARVAIEESVGTPDYGATKTQMAALLSRRFPIYVRHANRIGHLEDLYHLVDVIADSAEMAVCRVELMKHLGMPVGDDNLLPKSAAEWKNLDRVLAKTMILAVLDRYDAAIEASRELPDNRTSFTVQAIAGSWKDIANEAFEKALRAKAGSVDHARNWSWTLIAADRSGDLDLFDTAANALSDSQNDQDPTLADLRWRSLAIHGEFDRAISILDEVDPRTAALVRIDASRPEDALERFGFPSDRMGQDLTKWIDEAIAEQRKFADGPVVDQILDLLTLMRCLSAMGYDSEAWHIARSVSDSDIRVRSYSLRDYVISSVGMLGRDDWLLRLALGETDRMLSPTAEARLASSVAETDTETFKSVMTGLSKSLRGRSLRQRVRGACQLLLGEIPEGFDPTRDFQRLFDQVRGRNRLRNLPGRSQRGVIVASVGMAELFSLHGETEFASECLTNAIESGDLRALMALAQQQLGVGRADTAETLFARMHDLIDSTSRDGASYGIEDDIQTLKASIGQWIVARRVGDMQRSDELLTEIRLGLMSPSINLRTTVADYLVDQGESELATETLATLLPMVALGPREDLALFNSARSYGKLTQDENPAEAARWFDLAIINELDTANFRAGAYLTLPAYVRRYQISDALMQKNSEKLEQQVNRLLELDPIEINFAEKTIPKIREAGHDGLADRALDQILSAGIAYMDRFSFDAMKANNLAWVLAMNQRHLQEALRLSERAVMIEPDSATYRDTLAEILFLLDRQQEALELESACLLDDPTMWHLHQQIEKYRAAIEQ